MHETMLKRRIMRDLRGVSACRIEARTVVGFPDIVYATSGDDAATYLIEAKVCRIDGAWVKFYEPLKAEQCYWLQAFGRAGCRTAFVAAQPTPSAWSHAVVLPSEMLTSADAGAKRVEIERCRVFDLEQVSFWDILVQHPGLWCNTQVGDLPT